MPMTPGTTLGPYEIVSPLGAGGMGEVYRARDTRLGRDVAIKVLPQHLSAQSELRARLEREARTVSNLNHPHICTLFDVGREGETDFLVMELVEGETLAERLARGALPGAEVLKLGAQIADALDRAHREGVVHRDLKPGNVMLTRRGAKLMDFGLARATGLASAPGSGVSMAALTQSPTIAQPLTVEGTLIGTFQYMSPEQLEGREADTRSDLWALGCVLYEMATGRRAFEGRSQASLITSIMGSEPAPISQVAPLAPAGLDRLVRTCLTKDPEERAQTAHDLKLQLQGLMESSTDSVASAPGAPAATRTARGSRMPWVVAGAASLVAMAAVAFALIQARRAPGSAVQLTIVAPEHASIGPRSTLTQISPDGRHVVFPAQDSLGVQSIWVRSLDQPDARPLIEGRGATALFWSPDSRTIAVCDQREGEVRTVPIAGGPVTVLCAASSPRGGTWSRRGDILLAPAGDGPLMRVSASGGTLTQATWLDSTRNETGHRFPYFLPDGRHFLFTVLPPGPEGYAVHVGELGSRQHRFLLHSQTAATYAEPGYLLFTRNRQLLAQRFDAARRQLEGDAVVIGVAPQPTDIDAEPVATASPDGRLVYLESPPVARQLEWYDRSGRLLRVLDLPRRDWRQPAISPDGRQALVLSGPDLWLADLGREVASRLVESETPLLFPSWSPDGKRIAYTRTGAGREEIMIADPSGAAAPTLLPTSDASFKLVGAWTRQGIVLHLFRPDTKNDVWLRALEPDAPLQPLSVSRANEFTSRVSPDGRWIAYVSDQDDIAETYVAAFPSFAHRVRISTGGARQMWWMPGSDELCYVSTRTSMLMSATLIERDGRLEPTASRELFQPRAFESGTEGDFTPDGQRFLLAAPVPGARERSVRVVMDWTALLRR